MIELAAYDLSALLERDREAEEWLAVEAIDIAVDESEVAPDIDAAEISAVINMLKLTARLSDDATHWVLEE